MNFPELKANKIEDLMKLNKEELLFKVNDNWNKFMKASLEME